MAAFFYHQDPQDKLSCGSFFVSSSVFFLPRLPSRLSSLFRLPFLLLYRHLFCLLFRLCFVFCPLAIFCFVICFVFCPLVIFCFVICLFCSVFTDPRNRFHVQGRMHCESVPSPSSVDNFVEHL